jgi:hypothetical protein
MIQLRNADWIAEGFFTQDLQAKVKKELKQLEVLVSLEGKVINLVKEGTPSPFGLAGAYKSNNRRFIRTGDYYLKARVDIGPRIKEFYLYDSDLNAVKSKLYSKNRIERARYPYYARLICQNCLRKIINGYESHSKDIHCPWHEVLRNKSDALKTDMEINFHNGFNLEHALLLDIIAEQVLNRTSIAEDLLTKPEPTE